MSTKEEVVEILAEVEHQQWSAWAASLAHRVRGSRLARWTRLILTEYRDLTEEEKEQDREWARKAMDALAQAGLEISPGWSSDMKAAPRDGTEILWTDKGTVCVINFPTYKECFESGCWKPLGLLPVPPEKEQTP